MNIPRFSLGSWAFSFGPFEKDPWDFDRFRKEMSEPDLADFDLS